MELMETVRRQARSPTAQPSSEEKPVGLMLQLTSDHSSRFHSSKRWVMPLLPGPREIIYEISGYCSPIELYVSDEGAPRRARRQSLHNHVPRKSRRSSLPLPAAAYLPWLLPARDPSPPATYL